MEIETDSFFNYGFAKGIRPDPDYTVDEWADAHRILSSVSSSEPGPWQTSRVPYLREIMRCLSPSHPCERVILMKGAQIGGTECGNNWMGFVIHHTPGPMLIVNPTVEMAKRTSKMRIDPAIDNCPSLRELVKSPRTRDSGNTVLMKEFPGGVLVLTGANSAVGLRSMPVRYLFLDEVDGYPNDTGDEGDPVDLAIQRTATYKPQSESGSSKDLYIRMVLGFSEAPNIDIYINPHNSVVSSDKFEALQLKLDDYALKDFSNAAEHQKLPGLQGGNTTERYHLSKHEQSTVISLKSF